MCLFEDGHGYIDLRSLELCPDFNEKFSENNVYYDWYRNYFVVMESDKLELYNSRTGNIVWTVDMDLRDYDKCVFSPCGNKLALLCAVDLDVKILNLMDGSEATTLLEGEGNGGDEVSDVAFSRDGKFLAVSCLEDGVKIWNLETGESVFEVSPDDNVRHVEFIGDDEYLVTGSCHIVDNGELYDAGSISIYKLGENCCRDKLVFSTDNIVGNDVKKIAVSSLRDVIFFITDGEDAPLQCIDIGFRRKIKDGMKQFFGVLTIKEQAIWVHILNVYLINGQSKIDLSANSDIKKLFEMLRLPSRRRMIDHGIVFNA